MPYPALTAALMTVCVTTAAVAQTAQKSGNAVPNQAPQEPYGLSTQPASTGNPVAMSPTAARKEGTVPGSTSSVTPPGKN